MDYPRAKSVTIYNPHTSEEGAQYKVVALSRGDGSRGREYRCANDEGLIVTVCHAPPRKVLSAITSGRKIVYHW